MKEEMNQTKKPYWNTQNIGKGMLNKVGKVKSLDKPDEDQITHL